MTRKLKLDVEDLAVESFRTDSPGEEGRGTVRANSDAISFDATCDCTVGISADYNCYTDPFGSCVTQRGGPRYPGQNAEMC